MKITVRGVRSVEIEMSQPERAAEFYGKIWNLTEVAREDGSIWFRGTGAYHHILAIHPANGPAAMRRLTFDAANRDIVKALHQEGYRERLHHRSAARDRRGPAAATASASSTCEGRNLAVVCDARDHNDTADVRDRPRKIAHVNLNAAQLEKSNAFLIDVLGFRKVDHSGPLHFFHCDNTDHSSMVMGAAKTPTLNHVSFEMPDLESCMRGGGRMRDTGYPIEWGPGRHGSGNNVFCYFAGPGGIPIEYTAEVMQIDDSYEFHGPEYWKWPPGPARPMGHHAAAHRALEAHPGHGAVHAGTYRL